MTIILSTLNAKFIHTNIAIRYLKASALPEFDVTLAEYTIKDPIYNIVADLYLKKPDVLGFSCYIWNIEETIEVIRMMKTVNPDTVIVVGGPEVTYDAYDLLKRVPEIDYIVIGEGEQSFKELLKALDGRQEIAAVPGIAWLKDNKFTVHPPAAKADLRELPSPFRFPEDIQNLPRRITYIETSRGCPFSCQFCLSSIEVGVRYFNRERIKEDIRYLMNNGAKIIKFVDRTFNISRSYAMEMFQFLIDEHRPGVVFQFEITADIMRPEVIQFLNDNAPAGLFRFEIGVQSTNDLTNELVKRRQNFEKLKRTVTMVKEGGKIDQHLDLIAGLPEEDYDSFRTTFNDVFAMRPEELQLGFLKLLRGTGLRVQAKEYGYTYMDRAPYEIFSNNVLTFDEILQIKQAEDVLEKYWNAHRMDRTIEYLVSIYPSPFDFFQSFGTYWEERGWSRIGHQPEDLFRRLEAFLIEDGIANLGIVRDLLKLDYLLIQNGKPRKPWWPKDMEETERTGLYREIGSRPEIAGSLLDGMSEREMIKHTLLIPFGFDSQTGNPAEYSSGPGYLLALFRQGQSPSMKFIQKEQISSNHPVSRIVRNLE
ncbi:B12-binding domain-containing radical SAM protein [Planococcus lenghuensis]|uniref:B12-binding domain-containing radical SAM protein n=1 Tax=Planococcus lenghuensis TaxID=2213202 RepID=A0A1Q2L0E6_9BACL|nr:B12-binding domain-containing radical SAM protein [Planococcus lenghuensis]AQQ53876.1 B12-binding domain-containing radical SAM protein [Planococcus lenghuensis]